ncbi:hypothetical protein DFH08DRAFT_822051 [Mycena albidolilacea]|uniref:Uncharacterized protein n=1 Tax=Mycena albidolilacea TaxID=1033008 RepID=A0AAD7EDK7_9AGAR|nr:hypothetical protein DFH08DRAFT_822051 [Mycena albidolilacea]
MATYLGVEPTVFRKLRGNTSYYHKVEMTSEGLLRAFTQASNTHPHLAHLLNSCTILLLLQQHAMQPNSPGTFPPPPPRTPRMALRPLPTRARVKCTALFASSGSFFDISSDAHAKLNFGVPTGKSTLDAGYCDLPAEEQLLTLHCVSDMPPPHHRLGRHRRALHPHHAEPSSTMLDRFLTTCHRKRILSVPEKAHKDLGLLTLVIGPSPGLDACDSAGWWISVEDTPTGGAGTGGATANAAPGRTNTLLPHPRSVRLWRAPRLSPPPLLTPFLLFLSLHISTSSSSTAHADLCLLSIVFSLRPAPHVLISANKFTRSPLIGTFPPERLSK